MIFRCRSRGSIAKPGFLRQEDFDGTSKGPASLQSQGQHRHRDLCKHQAAYDEPAIVLSLAEDIAKY